MKGNNLSWRTICFCSISLLLASCTQEDPINPDLIREITVSSALTDTDYPIYIVLPENYQPSKKYQTLYVLDGNDELNGIPVYEKVSKLNQEASFKYGKQPAIVVGIGANNHRERDYSPTPIKGFEDGGGSENFAQFFDKELIPRIQREVSVDTTAKSRIISGHSLGGTFVGFLFTKHPNLFSNYLMLSPAYWWDDGKILQYEKETRTANAGRQTLVYVGWGEFEEPIGILAKEWALLMQKYYPNCKLDFKQIPNTAHISSAAEDILNGLDFYYKNQ